MQIPLINQHQRNFLPGGTPRLDWANPLLASCVGCYVPSAGGASIVSDLAGYSGNLVASNPTNLIPTPEGSALNCNSGDSGVMGGASTLMHSPNTVTLYFRGTLGIPSAVSAPCLSILPDNFGGAPFICYGLGVSISGPNLIVGADWTAGTSGSPVFHNGTTTVLPSTKNPVSLAATFNSAGNVLVYVNGKQVSSSAFGTGTLQYFSTCQVGFGRFADQSPPRFAGTNSLIGMFWNRILSADEMLQLHLNPYSHLIYPEDEIFDSWAPPATHAASQPHRHGVAG